MLDEIFEAVIAPLRTRGGHVLKFIGDARAGDLSVRRGGRGLDLPHRARRGGRGDRGTRNARRRAQERAGRPFAEVDIALHVGEVLYGNFGAVDRLDFTAIGPAVNEVARLEKLCEPLGRQS